MVISLEMKVIVLPPLDHLEENTLTLAEWLRKITHAPHGDPSCEIGGMDLFLRAVHAVTQYEYWEFNLRCMPRVAYNPERDEPFFIFKIVNNGTTFLVGDNLPDFEHKVGE